MREAVNQPSKGHTSQALFMNVQWNGNIWIDLETHKEQKDIPWCQYSPQGTIYQALYNNTCNDYYLVYNRVVLAPAGESKPDWILTEQNAQSQFVCVKKVGNDNNLQMDALTDDVEKWQLLTNIENET